MMPACSNPTITRLIVVGPMTAETISIDRELTNGFFE
jgi:hypothetical protein